MQETYSPSYHRALAPQVTVGVVNFNGLDILPDTLDALRRMDCANYEIMVIDNGSTDGSREWLRQHGSEFSRIFLPNNVGASGARNILLEKACSEYILFLDNDIRVEPNVLSVLMRTLRETPRAGLCHPEIRDGNAPDMFHYNGGHIHYLCALIARKRPVEGRERPKAEVFEVISGAALLVRRDLAKAVGGFDKDYFFNWEDGDFTARITLSGFLCLNVPQAVVHHQHKTRGTSKVFYQVRNRWYFILKLYEWKTILLIAPMLILFEMVQSSFLFLKGAGKDYLRGTVAAFIDLPNLLVKRRLFMKMKKMKDRDWLKAGEIFVPDQLNSRSGILHHLKRGFDLVFYLYWRLVSRLC